MKLITKIGILALTLIFLSGCIQNLAKCPMDVITLKKECKVDTDKKEKDKLMMLLLLAAASSQNSSSAPAPVMGNINSATDAKSPVSVAIEINGTGFGAIPGKIKFEDKSNSGNFKEVIPDTASWSNTGIVVTVPSAGTANFTVPSTLKVSVITTGGTSNSIELDLVTTPTFSPSNLAWQPSTPAPSLPSARTGAKAVAVYNSDTSAYLYVIGGQDNSANLKDAIYLTLTGGSSFSVGTSWKTTTSLPVARAFHDVVYSSPTNSIVKEGTAYLYAIGGQESKSDAPGGTKKVYYSAIKLTDGTIGEWKETTALPAERTAFSAFVAQGKVWIVGGLDTTGKVTNTIYYAKIKEDGTLDEFKTATKTLTTAVAFHTSFAFGGKLYVVGGQTTDSTNPNDTKSGGETDKAYYSSLITGEPGDFKETTSLGKNRKKHILFNVFGQVVVAEGIYNSWDNGSSELTSNTIDANGTLSSWGGLTGSKVPNVLSMNSAAALSPIYPSSGGPRFFIIGGMDASGNLKSNVYMNSAP